MHILEYLYYLGFSAKRYYSFRNRKRLPHKVISIGNITAGGTGKTPAAIALAREAMSRGYQPIILTRGYKGKAEGPCFVTTGAGPLLSVSEAGDEPFLMAEKLRGVPVVKGGDRYEAGMYALGKLAHGEKDRPAVLDEKSGSAIIFILDDGFQHFRLARDKDIVLVDAMNPYGNGRLLPLGLLREPVESLGRADIIILTKFRRAASDEGTKQDELIREIRRCNPRAKLFLARHVPACLRLVSGEKRPFSLAEGKKLFGFCALGNPDSFRATVECMGGDLVGFKTFRDHHMYEKADIDDIRDNAERSGAEWIVTTEKDIIKLRNNSLPGNLLVIEVDFSVEGDYYEEVFC